VICAAIGAQFTATGNSVNTSVSYSGRTQRGFRTRAASDDSFTTSISQRTWDSRNDISLVFLHGLDRVPVTLI
jgi:hypothetical protein